VDREVGSITYTQALNKRGGIEADFTVTRTADDSFLVVTGTAFGSHDLAWLRRQARQRSADVRITDVTGQYVCYGLWGPRSREILSRLTPADLSNAAFPFMTAQDIAVGDVAARALRVTFTGELGWEIYASSEYGAGLWKALWEAGRDLGLVAAGYRAIDSLRLEKGYRVWSTDVTPETNPYEAGLGFCVKLDKPGGFLGADALRAVKDAGVSRRLRCITLDDPRSIALGSEPVRVGDKVVGRVTSGGYGYTVGSSIAYAYLPTEVEVGSTVSIDIFGQWIGGVVASDPLFDPRSARVRLDVGEQP
jgi:4-methylaminobutanoate oxidase (formaldehyde-forming)